MRPKFVKKIQLLNYGSAPYQRVASVRFFSAWSNRLMLDWADVTAETVTPTKDLCTISNCAAANSDIVVLDRPRHAPNVGMLLRHLPILGGHRVFVIENSIADEKHESHEEEDIVRGRTFLKSCLRVSMANTRAKFGKRLAVVDSIESIANEFKHRRGYRFVGFENVEVFDRMNETGTSAMLPVHSLYEHPVLSDLNRPIAFLFGSEHGAGLNPKVLREYCDAGCFIPSLADNCGEEEIGEFDSSYDPDIEALNAETTQTGNFKDHFKLHTCNLGVAATLALSERARHRWTFLGKNRSR